MEKTIEHAYIKGFCKAAETYGVSPLSLAAYSTSGLWKEAQLSKVKNFWRGLKNLPLDLLASQKRNVTARSIRTARKALDKADANFLAGIHPDMRHMFEPGFRSVSAGRGAWSSVEKGLAGKNSQPYRNVFHVGDLYPADRNRVIRINRALHGRDLFSPLPEKHTVGDLVGNAKKRLNLELLAKDLPEVNFS